MKRLSREDRAGLYVTVIVHLAVLIVLLLVGLGAEVKEESRFVLDFSKAEEMERLEREAEQLRKEVELQQAISEKLQREIGSNQYYRNVAVDRASLKDDRNTDADKLYKDAERLQRELNAGYELPDEDHASLPDRNDHTPLSPGSQPKYSGPSVVSYFLEGRKASKLSIPAYRCMGAGEVTVLIMVDPQGSVVAAKVDESCSSKDGCLRAFAVRAARLSKFSANASAPARQSGNIVYQFIAQ